MIMPRLPLAGHVPRPPAYLTDFGLGLGFKVRQIMREAGEIISSGGVWGEPQSIIFISQKIDDRPVVIFYTKLPSIRN